MIRPLLIRNFVEIAALSAGGSPMVAEVRISAAAE